MNGRKTLEKDLVIVFDKIIKTSELNDLLKNFCGDVIITKKLVVDKRIDIKCNLYVIGGIVRKYPISDFDICIDGDFCCYGEIHCHSISVSGNFYSQKLIYSKAIKVGEDFLCEDKVDSYGCNIVVAGNFEAKAVVAKKIECLGKTKISGEVSVAEGITSGY